jgi:hypothetical protein
MLRALRSGKRIHHRGTGTQRKQNPLMWSHVVLLFAETKFAFSETLCLGVNSEFPPAFHCFQHRDFIGVLDIATGRDAGGNARHFESGAAKLA